MRTLIVPANKQNRSSELSSVASPVNSPPYGAVSVASRWESRNQMREREIACGSPQVSSGGPSSSYHSFSLPVGD